MVQIWRNLKMDQKCNFTHVMHTKCSRDKMHFLFEFKLLKFTPGLRGTARPCTRSRSIRAGRSRSFLYLESVPKVIISFGDKSRRLKQQRLQIAFKYLPDRNSYSFLLKSKQDRMQTNFPDVL